MSMSSRWSQKGLLEEELLGVKALRPVLLEPCLRSSSSSSYHHHPHHHPHHHHHHPDDQVMEEPAQGGEAIVSSSTSSSVIVQVIYRHNHQHHDHYDHRHHHRNHHNHHNHHKHDHDRQQAAEPALAQAPPPLHGLPQVSLTSPRAPSFFGCRRVVKVVVVGKDTISCLALSCQLTITRANLITL